MKLVIAIGLVLVIVLAITTRVGSSIQCPRGGAQGFVAIKTDPSFLPGTIPARFTDDARYFSRRFNCRGASAQVRRVDLGIYDVRFPKLDPQAVVADALSDEGISSSALPLSDGIVRIVFRGPLAGSDVASRRDVAFSVVVY